MVFHALALIGMLLSALGGGSSAGTTQVEYQAGPHSIALGPSQATADPGETVSYTVSVRTVGESFSGFSGSVLVNLPDGLSVVGQPVCSSGCGQPAVEVGSQGTEIQTSINAYVGEPASFSFQVMIDGNASVGTSYSLTAYLLGGISTGGSSETSFATLTVTEAAPSSGAASDAGPIVDRYAYLDVTPRLLRVAPGGAALYFIQPGFWGDWSANLPDYMVELHLPSGAELSAEPICGPRQSVVPEVSRCDVSVEKQEDGSMLVNARPGFVGVDSNGLYVTVEFEADLPIDTLLQIYVSLSVPGDVPASDQNEQSLGVLVVDPSAVSSSTESGIVAGRYEVHSGYFPQGDSCSISDSSSDYELSLFEWGAPDSALARIQVPTGRIGSASDGTGGDVCIIEFRFEDVPEFSVYMVAELAAGQMDVCRACVLGLITPSQAAEQVIVRSG